MSKPDSAPSTAIATVEHSSALAAPGDFGPEHMRIVREAFAPTASQAEFEVLWAGAKARRLDPVRKQIHFVKRKSKVDGAWVERWTSIVAIDGFRSIAEGTGKYDGQDEPTFEYDSQDRLIAARVRVYRKDISRPFVGVARWTEYVQTNADGKPNATWEKMEHTMLAKCAEALGLRKAFPEPLAGLYTGEEMMQADNEGNVSPAKPVEVRPIIEQRSADPHPDPLVGPLIRWRKCEATDEDIALIAASSDANHRAMVFGWRIEQAESLEELAKVATDIAADPHEEMRGHMLGVAEKRRAEMAAEGGRA